MGELGPALRLGDCNSKLSMSSEAEPGMECGDCKTALMEETDMAEGEGKGSLGWDDTDAMEQGEAKGVMREW